jgi:hypothetical protein
MSILYRGYFIDASYQVLFHLAKRLQRRKFLEIDQPETRIACGESKLGREHPWKVLYKIAHFVLIH